jgi:membrane protein DedA with SNARE-associated domain/putative flippase GtrA
MAGLAEHLLSAPAWVALLVVFAVPGLESSAFVGFVFPGEVALVLGGVLASQGRVPLWAVVAAAIVGCVLGDNVGYAVGRRWGRRLLDGTLGRFVHADRLDRAEAYLAARGGRAVFVGRFTATLRVLVPGLAGMSRMPYRTFLVANAASAVGWGTSSVLLGYLGGASWRHVTAVASHVALAVLVVVVVVPLTRHLLRSGRGARAGRDGARWIATTLHGVLSPEVLTFLAVGGAGYVVDVLVFNLLLSSGPFATMDPTVPRTLAVAAAMVVTYVGNRTLTWRDQPVADRRREVLLFVVFNVIGLGFSVLTLAVTHDLLGLTSRLDDNLSANVLGVALGTVFRYVTYRRFVFAAPASDPVPVDEPTVAGGVR